MPVVHIMVAVSISSLAHNHSEGQGGIHIPGGPFRLPSMGIEIGILPFPHSPLEVFPPRYLLDQFYAFPMSLLLNPWKMGGGEQYRKDIPPLEIPCHLVTLPCTHVTAFQNEFKEHRIPLAMAEWIFMQELYQDSVYQGGMGTPDKK